MDLLRELLRNRNLVSTGLGRISMLDDAVGIRYRSTAENLGFYYALSGRVYLRGPEVGLAVELAPGDLFWIVRGFHQELTCSTAARSFIEPLSGVLPQTVGRGDSVEASFIAGGYLFGAGGAPRVIWELPAWIILRADEIREDRRLTAAIGAVAAEVGQEEICAEGEVRTLLLHLLHRSVVAHWLKHQGPAEWWQRVQIDDDISEAVRLVQDRPDEAWTVAKLAQEVGLSRSTFVERFKRRIGESPMHYVSRLRVRRAANLLRETTKSVNDIADAVGYADQFAFSKAFKRVYAVCPRVYRSEARLDAPQFLEEG